VDSGATGEAAPDFSTFDATSPNCKPQSCADQGIECGPAGDGCGGIVADCGKCGPDMRCGGPNAPSKCVSPLVDGGACAPKTCVDLGVECGPAGDGCGAILQCGTCLTGFQCGADNAYSKCVSTGPTNPDGGVCSPLTQSDILATGVNCGQQSDGCGSTVDLGSCPVGQTCGGGGPSKCGGLGADGGSCTPKTCSDYLAQGINCGKQPDGCNGLTADCGSCGGGQVCGGGGVASQCGGGVVLGADGGTCTPMTTCAQAGKNCGVIANGCGGTITCPGSCPSGQTCGGSGTPNVCGVPACTPYTFAEACTNVGKNCGIVANGCGGTIDCGNGSNCTPPAICGGGGTANKCGGGVIVGADGGACTPQTCGSLGKNCGQVANGCGGLTADCGTCTNGNLCGGGGTPNVCGGAVSCTPKTQAQACANAGKNCGFVADGCGDLIQCGATCPAGQGCGGGGTPNVCGNIPFDAGVCDGGYCAQQVKCDGSTTTSIKGIVYAPEGSIPIYDALVYVPNTIPLADITTGVSCDKCTLPGGNPITTTHTNAKGEFQLDNVPAGTNIPIVIQIGKWRRMIKRNVTACTTQTITCNTGTASGRTNCLTRLPRTQHEGGENANNIPKMAITTGGADALQCLIRKVGIADTEFRQHDNNGNLGRIHLYKGLSGTTRFVDNFNNYTGNNRNLPAGSDLWDNTTRMNEYDALIFTCEGQEGGDDDSNDTRSASRPKVKAHADLGGRIFMSHWHHSWLEHGPTPWPNLATFVHEDNPDSPIDALINTASTFPKGIAMADWLQNARTPAGTYAHLDITESRHTVADVNATYSTAWVTLPSVTNPIATQYFTANTPAEAANADKCGRIVMSDLHVSAGDDSNDDFPDGCTSGGLSDQEKLLVFMLFDLTACVQADTNPTTNCTKKTCAQQGIDCGRAGDGCGDEIPGGCGVCPNGQVCGGGGANKCGGPTCTAKTCTQLGAECGQVNDGCGKVLTCPDCTGGKTCGGGGQPNKCGAPSCTQLNCAQQNIQCGPAGDGCGGTIASCGPCVAGVTTCGGSGTPGVCGSPACAQGTCGNKCGSVPNGCGGILNCGGCPGGQTCGGGGAANICGAASCSPKSCAQVGAQCGQASDTCGGLTVDCGTCQAGQVCQNNQCVTPQCTPTTCQAAGVACGPLADGCGNLLQCGNCPAGQTCGGGGVPGQCGGPTCTPRTCAQQNATCGQVADGCGGLTADCGSCPGTQTCVNGACLTTCTPRSCADAHANCGQVADGCGGLMDCGACQSGETCGGGGVANQCSGGIAK
jgi:hypothetical protein